MADTSRFAIICPCCEATLTIDAQTGVILSHEEKAKPVASFDEMDTTCCYAKQDKIWVRDPDGTPWEVFVTHEDAEEHGGGGIEAAEPATCC